ncbi:MAG TPA: alkaline phosphatase family protein [Nannocystaceae bacterium]|nr:alkaline phosphatase family protein [Nannocystaceae bacterium]
MNRKKLSEIRRLWSRRHAMGGIASLGIGVGACNSDASSDDGTTSDGTTSTGADTTTTTTSGTSSSEGSSSSGLDESSSSTGDTGPIMSDCEDAGSLTFEELVAPIEHIIVVMMENRSFDHVFGALALEGRTVDGLTGSESNPNPAGGDVAVFALTDPDAVIFDPDHGWNGSRVQWNEGANDGFVESYVDEGAPDPTLVMGYYERATLPVSYALADNYSLCDRWFASVMGPTWPNRFYLHLGTSGGMMTNDGVSEIPSVFDALTTAGITNVYYSSNVPFTLTYGKTEGVEQISAFYDALADGTLPQFSMVDPVFTDFAADPSTGTDDHPPADVTMGQAFLASVYAAVAASPLWNSTLLVITYDEHGGFFDHVPPPTTTDDLPDFEQLGFRVPAIVIGPHVRRGCVNSNVFDHVSVLSTVTRKWGLEPLTTRVDATADLSSCIDPSFVDDPQPPAPLPKMVVRRPKPYVVAPKGAAHDELFALADRHGLGPDQRRIAAQQAVDAVLAWGRKLGAFEVID